MVLSISDRREFITEISIWWLNPKLGGGAHVIAQRNAPKKSIIAPKIVCGKYTEQSPQHNFTATQLVQGFNEDEKIARLFTQRRKQHESHV